MTELQKNLKAFRPVLRGLPFIIVVLAGAMFLGDRYVRYASPVYESTAKIKLADINEGPSSTNLFKDFDVFANANKIQEEVELIRSRTIVGKALDSLKGGGVEYYRIGKIRNSEMYDESPFLVVNTSGSLSGTKIPVTISGNGQFTVTDVSDGNKIYTGKLGDAVNLRSGSIVIKKNEDAFAKKPDLQLADNYTFEIEDREKQIDNIISHLDVTAPDKDVAILRISYKSSVPQESADVVNAIAEAYIGDYIENKVKAANLTVNFINDQLVNITHQLSGSENSIADYRDENGIINFDQQTETDLRKIAEMKIDLANLQMNMVAIDSLVGYLQGGSADILEKAPNFQAFNDLLSTELMKQIKDLQAQKHDLLTKYTPTNPQVTVIDDKIKDIIAYILESCRNTQANLRIKYNQTVAAIHESEKVFDSLPAKEKEMAVLERYFNLNEKTYNFLNEKKMEAEIAQAANISFHRIIEAGIVPVAATSPNRFFILVLSGFIGLVIALTLLYLWNAVRPGIHNSDRIEKNSGIPLGGRLRFLKRRERIIPAFRKLIFDLKFKGFFAKGNTVCISSYRSREGKSFIARNMAELFAKDNLLTLLITCDNDESGLQELERLVRYDNSMFYPGRLYHISLSETDILTQEFEKYIPFVQQVFHKIVIDNFSLTTAVASIGMMRQSHQNILVLDALRTPPSAPGEMEEIFHEYHLEQPFFLMNRERATTLSFFLFRIFSKERRRVQETAEHGFSLSAEPNI